MMGVSIRPFGTFMFIIQLFHIGNGLYRKIINKVTVYKSIAANADFCHSDLNFELKDILLREAFRS